MKYPKYPFVALVLFISLLITGIVVYVDFSRNKDASQVAGVLAGKVTIGPICPVEREDMPCPIPPEVYTSREMIVYTSDGKTVVARAHLDATGHYHFDLAPGTYTVDMSDSGMASSPVLPSKVEIRSGKRTELDIDIDTGIR